MDNNDLAERVDGRVLSYASQLQQMWKIEIENAIDKVKNYKKRTADDKWFRKMWYIAQARDRKKKRVLG